MRPPLTRKELAHHLGVHRNSVAKVIDATGLKQLRLANLKNEESGGGRFALSGTVMANFSLTLSEPKFVLSGTEVRAFRNHPQGYVFDTMAFWNP